MMLLGFINAVIGAVAIAIGFIASFLLIIGPMFAIAALVDAQGKLMIILYVLYFFLLPKLTKPLIILTGFVNRTL